MESNRPPEVLSENLDGVRQFFEQWAVYRKVVDHNYLHHREAYAALEKALKEIPGPFSFLEMGAGDASFTAPILGQCAISLYEGVDISETALELAKKNLEALSCRKNFIRGDFFEHVPNILESFDVAFIGLSFHHLAEADKLVFFSEIRRVVRPGGSFFFYEPVMEAEETRGEVMDRFATLTDRWTAMSAEELRDIKKHVFENDYPETVENFTAMAAEAGFASTRVLYMDDERLYAVFRCW